MSRQSYSVSSSLPGIWLWVKTNGIPFWLVGAPPILVYFSGDWDVHWGVRDFDPWPFEWVFDTLAHISGVRGRTPFLR